jgi:signal transduction histidine kinase
LKKELRTPVNAIYGLTEQALQKPMDPEVKELISVISKSSRHLKNIINDTLDFSKMEADKIELQSVDWLPICIAFSQC